jgi:hypothetical protein
LGTSSRTTTIKVDGGKSDTSNALPWILPAPSMGVHYLVFTKDSLTALLSVNVLAGTFRRSFSNLLLTLSCFVYSFCVRF